MSEAAARAGARILESPLAVEAVLFVQTAGERVGGDWVPGTIVPADVSVVTVPVTGDDRATLPEGTREEDTRKFYLAGPVSAIVAGESEGDVVRFMAVNYRVIRAKDWSGFFEVLAVRQEAVPA